MAWLHVCCGISSRSSECPWQSLGCAGSWSLSQLDCQAAPWGREDPSGVEELHPKCLLVVARPRVCFQQPLISEGTMEGAWKGKCLFCLHHFPGLSADRAWGGVGEWQSPPCWHRICSAGNASSPNTAAHTKPGCHPLAAGSGAAFLRVPAEPDQMGLGVCSGSSSGVTLGAAWSCLLSCAVPALLRGVAVSGSHVTGRVQCRTPPAAVSSAGRPQPLGYVSVHPDPTDFCHPC